MRPITIETVIKMPHSMDTEKLGMYSMILVRYTFLGYSRISLVPHLHLHNFFSLLFGFLTWHFVHIKNYYSKKT